jgi:hypothetical protein
MTLAVTATDNATTPTGATVNITGSGGAVVSVYYCPVQYQWQATTWTLAGTRTGDGSFLLALSPQQYFVFAQTSSSMSLPVRFQVTDGLASVAARCAIGIVNYILELNLAEIGSSVVSQIFPDETEIQFPAIVVCNGNNSESEETGLNSLDYVVYPFTLVVADVHPALDHTVNAKYQHWRQQIARSFRVLPDLGVPELAYVRLNYGAIANYDSENRTANKMVSLMTINCVCRERRGLGA